MATILAIRLGSRPVCNICCGLNQLNQRTYTYLRNNQSSFLSLKKYERQYVNRKSTQGIESSGGKPQQPIPQSTDIKSILKESDVKVKKTKSSGYATDDMSTDSELIKNESDEDKKQVAKTKLTTTAVRENVKGYLFVRFSDHVKNYDSVLEKNFPSAMKIYRVFFDGVREFYGDMMRYLKVSRIASDQGLKALNRRELELLMQMPRDMFKVAPALILSSLPLVGYAIFPLAVMYPHALLTTHFWTTEQRNQFLELNLQKRLKCNRSVFRQLQQKLDQKSKNPQERLESIFAQIGSGFHPKISDILSVKEIFASPPFDILSLSGKHIKLLCTMHGVPHGLFKRNRLREHAILVHNMDLAIRREGGEHNMNPDALRISCYIRGLNPTNLSNEVMVEWLRDWTTISTILLEEHLTLFLHLPLFLAYNHPNNWPLIYGK